MEYISMEYISEAYVDDLKRKVKKLASELAAERDEKTALMAVLQAEHKAHEAKSESMKRIRSVLRETILKLKYMENNSAGWQQRSNKFQSHLAEEREAHEATKRELAALNERLEKAPEATVRCETRPACPGRKFFVVESFCYLDDYPNFIPYQSKRVKFVEVDG